MTDREPQAPADGPAQGAARNRISALIWTVVALCILGLLVLGFFTSRDARPAVGEPAPSFALTTWDGDRVSLRDLRGRVVVLNFWASWCTPCQREAPALQEVWTAVQGQDVIFLGVTFRDAEEASRAFVQRYGITYANATDERGQVSRTYGVLAVPETFVVDREGRVAQIFVGEVDAGTLAAQIETTAGP